MLKIKVQEKGLSKPPRLSRIDLLIRECEVSVHK